MAHCYIEHINITVSDVNKTAEMLIALFDWKIRWQGKAQVAGYTIHVGDDSQYIAIWAPDVDGGAPTNHKKALPLNHIGIEVDDLDEIDRRVKAYGFTTHSYYDYEPGKRFYFFDHDGIEYEIVSYK